MTVTTSVPERGALQGVRLWPAVLLVAMAVLALLFPAGAFTVDEAIYVEMARAMADTGSFAIAGNGGVEGGPTLLRRFTHDVGGLAMPQYPSGYAIVAAPFYALFGLNGLILLNVLSAAACLWLTHRIGRQLYGDDRIAVTAAVLFGAATFMSTYAFGIWPHMLTLALLLAGVERILTGLDRDRLIWIASGGLFLSIALTIRVDAILAILAVFIWLRLFAAPARRSVALVFCAGLLPGLLVACLINQAKFDVFLPFAYGPAGQDGHSDPYLPYLGAVGVALLGLFVLDVSRPWAQAALEHVRRLPVVLALGAIALVGIALIGPVRELVINTGILLFDLQQIDPGRSSDVMTYDEGGLKTFWGLNKTALFQSVPFAVLGLFALEQFWRGQHVRAHALGLGILAAYALFYGLDQWHGGFSFTMRYFIPILPFLALMSACLLCDLAGEGRILSRELRMGLFAGAGLGLCAALLAMRLPSLSGVMNYYVPVAVAAGLFAAMLIWRVQGARAAASTLTVAGIAIGVSAMLALQDLSQLTGRMSGQSSISARYAETVPRGALLATHSERWMVRASGEGAHVVNPRGHGDVEAAASAFLAAGRCVFAHGEAARDRLDPTGAVAWQAVPQGPEDEMMGPLYVPVQQAGQCVSGQHDLPKG